MRQQPPSIELLAQGLAEGNKVALSRAITLVESDRATDRILATQLVTKILQHTGRSLRVGISGVPGVGKSTFIEALGKYLTAKNKKVAVLAVDPSSSKTKGSILGDKTRMEELSKDPLAFIRPTPSGAQLGGVAGNTRETILLCEAAGFEVILIETVGVGQSETTVRGMVDFFLLLVLAGAGDELQGIKKGIIEMADALVINKADGDNLPRVKQAKADLLHAIHLTESSVPGWNTPVLTCSALTKHGVDEVWQMIETYRSRTIQNGFFENNRAVQNKTWMNESFEQMLRSAVEQMPALQQKKLELEQLVLNKTLSASEAARSLFEEAKKQMRVQ